MTKTLFDKYGGVPTVTSIVRAFYKEVLKNYKLKPYFENIDTERLIHHQIGFISHLLGEVLTAHKMDPVDIKAVADLVISCKGEIVEIQNSVRVHKT